MDWTPSAMWIVYAGLALWNLTALYFLVTACLDWLGRRRDQRRAEARLHEEGKRRLLRARDKVMAELAAEKRQQANGATSSASTRGRSERR